MSIGFLRIPLSASSNHLFNRIESSSSLNHLISVSPSIHDSQMQSTCGGLDGRSTVLNIGFYIWKTCSVIQRVFFFSGVSFLNHRIHESNLWETPQKGCSAFF
ncbi:hypothetical protein ACS0TY_008496 [Phlomoides rotata]